MQSAVKVVFLIDADLGVLEAILPSRHNDTVLRPIFRPKHRASRWIRLTTNLWLCWWYISRNPTQQAFEITELIPFARVRY